MNISANNITQTEDCIILGWNATIPWDNPSNLISVETYRLVETVKCVILIPILYIIGAPANIINMAVFFKQGLNERINLCIFILAMADFSFTTFLVICRFSSIFALFINSEQFGIVYIDIVNNNLLGLYGFMYTATFLTSIIATERCVCVLFPLRAQRCIRTKVFAFALFLSIFVILFLRFVVTLKYRTACFFEERTGSRSMKEHVNDFYWQHREMLNILDGIFYGFCITIGCPVTTCIATVITAVRLRQIIQWRDQASSAMSSKEIGVTKMLLCLSVENIILSIPVIVLRVLPVFEPELRYGGIYTNLFSLLISVAELFACISSCANFFVYYFTGSRFRQTLHQLLKCELSSLSCLSSSSKAITNKKSSKTLQN